MLSSQSGVSEAPKPGCSGASTSWRAARSARKGNQPAPPPPCRNSSGRPVPPRISVMLQPRTEILVVVGSVIGAPGSRGYAILRENAALAAPSCRCRQTALPPPFRCPFSTEQDLTEQGLTEQDNDHDHFLFHDPDSLCGHL